MIRSVYDPLQVVTTNYYAEFIYLKKIYEIKLI